MIRLEYFTSVDFQQLIDWITDEKLLINWSGSMFTFPLTVEKLAWYINGVNDPGKSDAMVYKVIDCQTETVVGHISLGSINRKNKAARISRVLVGDIKKRGNGYCSNMVKSILGIGFEELKLHRITLGVYDFNTGAIRCYEKAGFVKEGRLRDVLQYQNSYWSLVEMSILEDEWRQRNWASKAA